MEAYVTEEQQLESIKRWFKKYGNALSWGLIIILLGVAATRYWFHHQTVLHNEASEVYSLLMTAVEQKDEATLKNKANDLIMQYPKSAYATFAAFVLASDAIKANDFAKAQEHFQWVIDHSQQSNFKALAKVRLMRLLLSNGKLDEALKLYDPKSAAGYLPMMEELRGDILLQQNKPLLAAQAYQKAMKDVPQEGMNGPLLKLKLEDLGIDSQTDLAPEKMPKEAIK